MKMKRLIAMAAGLLTVSGLALAQGITYQQAITWGGLLKVSGPGPSDIIRDVNQTGAWLYACASSNASLNATMELEGSYDKVNWFQIGGLATVSAVTTQCTAMNASGYFPFTRLNVLTLTTGGSPVITLSANYSASFTPITQQGAQRLGQQTQKVLFEALSQNFASNAVSSTPIAVVAGPAAFVSISVYNPNATVVYAVLSNAASWPLLTGFGLVGQGYAIAVPPTSSVSASFPVPLQIVPSGVSPSVYAACTSTFGSLVAPGAPCTVSASGYMLNSINTLVNAAGTPINTAIDYTGW
jgi:hypothetical protein